MTRYYVYTVKTDNPGERVNAFVEDPQLFAFHRFNPETMEFSGVFVEADTPQAANEVFVCPKENDIFVSCDEPRPTVLKRRAYESRMRLMQSKLKEMQSAVDKAEEDVQRLRMQTLVLEIAAMFAQISVKSSELSRLIKAISKPGEDGEFSNEQIYERLMQRYAEQVTQLRYRPGAGE